MLQLFLTFFQKLSCQIIFLCCNIFIKSFHKKIPRKELKKIFFDKKNTQITIFEEEKKALQ